jgi:hypothetical protein
MLQQDDQKYEKLPMVVNEVLPQMQDLENNRGFESPAKEERPIKPSEESGSSALLNAIMAWSSLALAILSGASIGPMFKYMLGNGVPILLAASW